MTGLIQHGGAVVVPLVEERAVVHKELVESGRVIINTRVVNREVIVEAQLRHEDVSVRRVEINRPVDTVPVFRTEGDVDIYPIVEEELVVTKQLVLREEIHVTRRLRVEQTEQPVTLRTVQADVHRTTPEADISPNRPFSK